MQFKVLTMITALFALIPPKEGETDPEKKEPVKKSVTKSAGDYVTQEELDNAGVKAADWITDGILEAGALVDKDGKQVWVAADAAQMQKTATSPGSTKVADAKTDGTLQTATLAGTPP